MARLVMISDAGKLPVDIKQNMRVESLDSATGEHTMNTSTSDAQQGMGGFLGWIERSGNKLPDPVFLFFWLILGLVAISVLAAMTGVSAAPDKN